MRGFKAAILGLAVLTVVGAGITACEPAGGEVAGESDDTLATVQFALTVVPTSVACIRITATPASGSVTTKTFTVTAGSASTTLTMGLLAPGSYTMSGDAFTSTCSSDG